MFARIVEPLRYTYSYWFVSDVNSAFGITEAGKTKQNKTCMHAKVSERESEREAKCAARFFLRQTKYQLDPCSD